MTDFHSSAENQPLGIDLSGSSAESNHQPIPPARYLLQFDEVTNKETNASKQANTKDGWYLEAVYRVIGGPCENRVVYHSFNYANPNADAVRIGQQQLKQFMIAAGGDPNKQLTMADLTALLGREVQADVIVEKSKNPQYGDKNKIKEFFGPNGEKVTDDGLAAPVNTPATVVPTSPPMQQQQPAPQATQQQPAGQDQAQAQVQTQQHPQATQPADAAPAQGGPMPWNKGQQQ